MLKSKVEVRKKIEHERLSDSNTVWFNETLTSGKREKIGKQLFNFEANCDIGNANN